MRRVIVVLHGLLSDGEWYAAVRQVLGSEFEIHEIHYPHYQLRWGGPLALVLEPAVIVLGLPLAMTVGYAVHPGWMVTSAFVLAVIGLARWARRFRWHRAVAYIRQRWPKGGTIALPPHVMAHSLGGRLILEVLSDKNALYRADRLLLVGAVLPRDFDWTKLLDNGTVQWVQHETGGADWVAGIAQVAARWRLVRGFGSSGRDGLSHASVHSVSKPAGSCEHCHDSGLAQVHDVMVSGYSHNDALKEENLGLASWLPFMRGNDPAEFAALVRLACQHAINRSEDLIQADITLGVALRRHWKWADGSLDQFIRSVILRMATPGRELSASELDDLVVLCCEAALALIADAYLAVQQGAANPVARQRLNPKRAVHDAARRVLGLAPK